MPRALWKIEGGTMQSPLDVVQPGTVVGPYRIMRGFRGQGGMAQIFEVEVRAKYRQPSMPHRMALKVAKPQHQAALVAEADYLRLFDHPNIVCIYPLPGFHKPVYAARAEFPFGLGWYYAMELLDGGALDRTLMQTSTLVNMLRPAKVPQRRLSIFVALGIVRQIADALAYIHERSVVNLDVKPANILFRRRRLAGLRSSVPQAVLGDFGIARDLRYPRAGLLGMATPEYVSPEHASELRAQLVSLDCRSDIFSLGVVLYEMLTGKMPFTNVALIMDARFVPPSPRSLRRAISPALDDLVMRALDKDPARRFQSAAEMRMALDRVASRVDWPLVKRFFAVGVLLGGLAGGGVWLNAQRQNVVIDVEEAAPVLTLTAQATLTPGVTPTATLTQAPQPTAVRSLGGATSTPWLTATPTPPAVPPR